MHDSICEKKDYFYLFYKYSDLTLQTFINRLNNRKINEDTIDMKQIEISKYSLIGKEIASKDPSINGSLLNLIFNARIIDCILIYILYYLII